MILLIVFYYCSELIDKLLFVVEISLRICVGITLSGTISNFLYLSHSKQAEAASQCQTSGKPRESFEDYFRAASSDNNQNLTERFEKKLHGDEKVNVEVASNSDLKVIEEKSSKPPTAKENRKKKEPRKKSRTKSEKSTVDKKATKKTLRYYVHVETLVGNSMFNLKMNTRAMRNINLGPN